MRGELRCVRCVGFGVETGFGMDARFGMGAEFGVGAGFVALRRHSLAGAAGAGVQGRAWSEWWESVGLLGLTLGLPALRLLGARPARVERVSALRMGWLYIGVLLRNRNLKEA